MVLGQRATMNAYSYDPPWSHAVSYEYDKFNRIERRISPEGTVIYAHDVQGNVTKIAAIDPATLYQYDALNRLTNVYQGPPDGPATVGTTYQYDAVGNLQEVQLPNNSVNTY